MSSKEIPNEWDNKTVHTITHDEIKATGRSQCRMDQHTFKKLSDNEIHCDTCQTTLIIDPKKIKQYVS